MTDDPFLQSLIEAGRSELPDPARLEAIAHKLGPAIAAGGGGAAAAATATKATLWSSGLVKAALVLTVLAGVGATTVALTRPAPGVTPQPMPMQSASIAAPPEPIVADLAPVPSAPASVAPSARPSLHVTPSAEDPEEEARLLHRAQDALAASPAKALALGQEHARRFPHGLLAQEREVLAIDALVRLGRNAEATRRAEAFARTYPSSSHRRRIDALLSAP